MTATEPVLNIVGLPPAQRAAFWEGYRSGVIEGITMGRDQAADEAERSWASMAARVRRMATTSVPYSVLCERRGEPERAELARQHERRIGLSVLS